RRGARAGRAPASARLLKHQVAPKPCRRRGPHRPRAPPPDNAGSKPPLTRLTERVLTLTGASNIEWCDFRFTKGISARDNYGDRELKGLDFLEANNPVRSAWSKCWPQTGNIQNWDAV